MVLLQFILDTMIKFKKSLSKIISDLEESSPIFKNSLLEISPVCFCVNVKNHKNIYIVIDRDNSNVLFEEIEHQFEINGSLFELLKLVITKKINKNIIKGDVELAMTFFNIIFNSNIDLIYLIDKYFGSLPAVFTLAVTQRLFNTSVVYDDIEYRNIRKRLRDISIRLDRLEIIK